MLLGIGIARAFWAENAPLCCILCYLCFSHTISIRTVAPESRFLSRPGLWRRIPGGGIRKDGKRTAALDSETHTVDTSDQSVIRLDGRI